jgi:hypothetical protein
MPFASSRGLPLHRADARLGKPAQATLGDHAIHRKVVALTGHLWHFLRRKAIADGQHVPPAAAPARIARCGRKSRRHSRYGIRDASNPANGTRKMSAAISGHRFHPVWNAVGACFEDLKGPHAPKDQAASPCPTTTGRPVTNPRHRCNMARSGAVSISLPKLNERPDAQSRSGVFRAIGQDDAMPMERSAPPRLMVDLIAPLRDDRALRSRFFSASIPCAIGGMPHAHAGAGNARSGSSTLFWAPA